LTKNIFYYIIIRMEAEKENIKYPYDVVVIGGGASGMMIAGRVAELGGRVLVLEKNRVLGRKLRITGGMRCNITNAEFDNRKFLDNFPQAKDYLYSPFSKFSVKDTFDFFEKLGLPLVIEARKRVFPESQKAEDVYEVLRNYLEKNGARIKLGVKVTGLEAVDGEVVKVKIQGGKTIRAKYFVIATGGMAAPETGSTGDGFRWLRKLGHTIIDSNPNLVPLTTDSEWVKRLAGVSWSFLKLSFLTEGKVRIKKLGKILFTHFGISGPLVLNSSYEVQQLLKENKVQASLDLFPDTNLGDLDRKIWRHFEKNKNKLVKNVLPELLYKNIGDELLGFARFAKLAEKPVHSVTKEERRELAEILKDWRFNITGTLGYKKSIVADGGLDLKEVDFKNMSSKKYNNLYVLGDVLNINRPSGGFSLQLCWTTAWVGATSIAKKITKKE